jgi:uncharacterized membrane protein
MFRGRGRPPASIVVAQLIARAGLVANGGTWLVTGLFNLILLAIAAAWMARGCLTANLRQTIAGSLVFIVLVMARYFDLFQSLAVRGLIFVGLGGLLVAQGVLFRRARRLGRAGEQPA